MAYFFTSDTHFGHKNIIDFCERPFKNLKEMDETLIRNWNSVVKENDIVFHLGDYGWSNKTKIYLNRLNGTIIKIKGNHDSKSYSPIIDMTINLGGKHWYLIHDPKEAFGEYNIVGHVHKNWKSIRMLEKGRVVGYAINVGVDVRDYRPVSLKTILKELEILKKNE